MLDFAEFTADPRAVLMRVYDFLGLDKHYFPKRFKVRNPTQRKVGSLGRLKQRWSAFLTLTTAFFSASASGSGM